MVDDSWHGGRVICLDQLSLPSASISNRPDAKRRARRCEHEREKSPQDTTLADCSFLDHCSYSLCLGNRLYAPFFFGAHAPLAAPHAVVEIENVKLDLVVDSILSS